MCCEMALGVTLSSAAASTKLPRRALASNALRALSGGILRDTMSGGEGIPLAFLLLGVLVGNIHLIFLGDLRALPGDLQQRTCYFG
jgi:hypothetical protein